MEVVKIKITKLNPSEQNPRIISESSLELLKTSITEFEDMLQARPIVADENLNILGGNMRYLACKQLGIESVPVIVIEGLSETEKSQFVIKDNVSTGYWKHDVIRDNFSEDDIYSWGFDEDIEFDVWDFDQNKINEAMQSFDDNSIRQMAIYYEEKDFVKIIKKFDEIGKKEGLSDNTEVLMKLISLYEL